MYVYNSLPLFFFFLFFNRKKRNRCYWVNDIVEWMKERLSVRESKREGEREREHMCTHERASSRTDRQARRQTRKEREKEREREREREREKNQVSQSLMSDHIFLTIAPTATRETGIDREEVRVFIHPSIVILRTLYLSFILQFIDYLFILLLIIIAIIVIYCHKNRYLFTVG